MPPRSTCLSIAEVLLLAPPAIARERAAAFHAVREGASARALLWKRADSRQRVAG